MTRDEFIQCVMSQPDHSRRVAAASSAITSLTSFAPVALNDVDGRMAAIRTIKSLQQHILALLEAPIPAGVLDPVQFAHQRIRLVTDISKVWTSRMVRFRYQQRKRVMRRPFRLEHAGAPPFRDAEHEALRVRSADAQSDPLPDGHRFSFETVEPFVDHRSDRRSRAANCLCWLQPGHVEPRHLRDPREQSLVDQQGLFARVDIPKGTCVGVYGGQVMDEVDVFLVKDDRYLLGVAATKPGIHAINGENLLSLCNTIYSYDGNGRLSGHPDAGYDLVRVTFRAQFDHGWEFAMPAFFADRDIEAGTELRWNYMQKKV